MSIASWSVPAASVEPIAEPAGIVSPVPGAEPPAPGVVEPIAPSMRLPRRATESVPLLWVLGAHGGAAESTVAFSLKGARASGHTWPAGPGGQVPVLLSARTSMIGLQAAQRALTDWASGATGVRLAGIVLVADAPGRLPRPLSDVVATIGGTAPGLWRLPWCQAWRTAKQPSLRLADRKFIGALGAMAKALRTSLADT